MTGREAADRFPQRYAVTQRYTFGAPRSFVVAGGRVMFVRSRGPEDPMGCLWSMDPSTGQERLIADPAEMDASEEMSIEEHARRERLREGAGGIVAYAVDKDASVAVFVLGGEAFATDVAAAKVRRVQLPAPVVDPRPDRRGHRVAGVVDGALYVATLDDETPAQRLVADDDPDVTWGLSEFIAAEEMGRLRGYWWAPDGQALAVARVDTRPVSRWYVTNPADPHLEPLVLRYPTAGTANADASLHIVTVEGGTTEVRWDRTALPYLADVVWDEDGPLTVVVESRDQRRVEILTVDADGDTSVAAALTDADWVDLETGAPRWAAGKLVTVVADRDVDAYRLVVDGRPVTPPDLQVRRLVEAAGDRLVFTASQDDPTEVRVFSVAPDGSGLHRLSPADAVSDAVAQGGITVVVTRTLHEPVARVTVMSPDGEQRVRSNAETPDLPLNLSLHSLGDRRLPAAVLLPDGRWAGDGGPPLPVLLDPYGGPHAQRVVRSYNAHLSSQWFAEQGFAVLVVDGRGTPGRGPAWERTLAGDLAAAPLQDQVDALHALAQEHPGLLDLERVAIKGWSFGGYLAGLAVLRRPDVFSAAIAGAPVTDWALYDTHYTERYLGTPSEQPEAYLGSSLLHDAGKLERPLLLIHGLADDNVVAAHTLRLSRALLEAGKPHRVLPLAGVTHMTPQAVLAENLLRLQLLFLQEALGLS